MRPLRVLQVTDHLRAGGAERMVAGLVAALDETDLARSIVCTGRQDDDADELTALVDRTATEHVVLGRSRQIDPRIGVELARVGRRHHVDVVHAHPGTLHPHAHIAARILGVPQVTTLHTMPGPLTENSRARDRADTWTGRRCAAVAAPAATVAAAFGPRWKLGAERVWIIPNAVFANVVDVETQPSSGDGGLPRGRVVLTVARLLRAKGLYDLVEAARTVVERHPDVRFAIAGDGPAESGLRAQIVRYGLERQVILLGHRPDVSRLLDRATVFCLPSHHEGVPLSVLEAMARGLPCVTTAVGGIPDVVRDGVDGIVVPPQDPPALAAAIERVLDDSGLAHGLGEAAASTAEREHTATIAARRYAELYRSVVDRAAA